MSVANDSDPHGVSIVVATSRGRCNVLVLADSIARALADAGHNWELILVGDDSAADIEVQVAELSGHLPIRVDVCSAPPVDLSLAVLRGLTLAVHKRVVVMDADLSHPPEYIDRLLTKLDGDCDMVIGSRYVEGASIDEGWGLAHRLNSRLAAVLVRPLVRCADPMSGFFAVHKCSLPSPVSLHPVGVKIGLELMVRGRLRVAEARIRFRSQCVGRCKMSFRQQWDFLRHLSRLYRFKFGRTARIAAFGLVGTSGFLIDLAGYLSLQSLGAGHITARLASFWPAVTWNWWLNRGVTFQERPKRPVMRQWIEFIASSLLGFAANVGTYVVLTEHVGFFAQEHVAALICGVAIGAFANFLTASKYVYPQGPTAASDTHPQPRT